MSISPVSNNNNNYTLNSNGSDSAIKLLEKQKQDLQEKIQKINDGKDEPKVKQDKIKEIQTQIQEIESQIQMIRTEKMREKQKIEKEDENAQTEQVGNITSNIDGDTLSLSNMTSLLSSSNSYSQLKTISGIKTNMNGTARVLKIEIKIDEARGVDTTDKKNALREIEKNARGLDKKIGEENNKIQKNVKKDIDEKDKAKDDDNQEKDEKDQEQLEI